MDITLPTADLQAALSNPLLQGVLQSCSDGAVVIDAHTRQILAINVRARELLGIGPKDGLGCACKETLNSPICATSCPLTAQLRGEAPEPRSLFYRGRDREQVLHANTRMLVVRGPDGTALAGVELFRDLGEIRALERRLRDRRSLHGIVGRSATMQALYDLVEQIAPYNLPVLLTGESGVGKERFADAIQSLSDRATGPYVKVNCAALSATLVESELFGHKRGAFTGAAGDRRGRFEEADGGTLLLDEVGELPPGLQAKLLRAIQQGEVQRVGDDRPRKADVRVLAATNRAVEEEVAAGRFREDLYYRLAGVRIHIPPLRERPGDIPLLAEHFLDDFSQEASARGRPRPVPRLTDEARAALLTQPWRGNVRELENVLRLACIRTPPDQDIGAELVRAGPPRTEAPEPPEAELNLAALERQTILQAMARSGQNLSVAARLLGIDRTTLWRKLRRVSEAA